MLWRILRLFLAITAATLIVTIAIANRHTVPLILDPVSEKPILLIERRMFEYLLAALILGVVLGGFATWLTQSHWRRSARVRAQEAMRWQGREQSDNIEDRRGMRVPGGRGTGFGCIGILVVMVIAMLTGADSRQLLSLLGVVEQLAPP